jgi:putative DNA primase/helicase
MEKQPYHVRVADEVIKALENGTAPWIKPWKPGTQPGKPINALTGKPYRGWNSVYLSFKNTGDDPRWCTYKQASELGGQVKKGSKGTVVQYWQFQEKKLVKDDVGKPKLDEKGEKQYEVIALERPKAFHAVVFHASQIDGLPEYKAKETKLEWERHELADMILKASGANILHDQSDRAYYSSRDDEIHLPAPDQFETSDAYYATALHELGHWTGHETRLNRDISNPFGSQAYAKEELRAELASYMIGSEIEIGHDPGQHSAYIGSWISVLKDDPLELFRASRDAQNAMDYVIGLSQERSIEQTQEVAQEREAISMEAMNTPKNDSITEEIVWLSVPYAEKDEAKKYGAKWDKSEKSWYIPEGINYEPLARWLIDEQAPRQDPALDPQSEFLEALKAAGLEIDGMPQMDGTLHRVKVEGDKLGVKSGAYKGFLDGHPAGFIQNFKTGYKNNWKASGQKLNAQEIAKLENIALAKRQAREQEREEMYQQKSLEVKKTYQSLRLAPASHGYLAKKGLHEKGHAFGARVDDKGNLFVPLMDKDNRIWGAQRIGINGFKSYEKGARVAGCFYVIGGKEKLDSQDPQEPILISTGFGTSAAINAATDKPVVVSFQDNNLMDVAKSFKEMYPDRPVIICGDDDRHLPERVPPLPNSGREKAVEAAKAVDGRAVFPQFTPEEKGREFTDFSDLHRTRGLQAVERQIKHALSKSRETRNCYSKPRREIKNTVSHSR